MPVNEEVGYIAECDEPDCGWKSNLCVLKRDAQESLDYHYSEIHPDEPKPAREE